MTTQRIRNHAAGVFLVLFAVWMAGCSMQPRPIWVEGEGRGLQVPWRKPGEARRNARETAILEARLRIRGQLLPEPILRQNRLAPEVAVAAAPLSRADSAGPTRSTASSAPSHPTGLVPLDSPTSATWKIETDRRNWSSEEKALLRSMTIEQLAAINPAFRAKFDHIIGGLDPLSEAHNADGTVVVRMRIDMNEVLRLARKYLE